MKKLKFVGLVLLIISSLIYGYVHPEKVIVKKKRSPSITLAGAFKKNGTYKIKEGMLLKDVVKDVGVLPEANMKAISLSEKVHAEQTIYLPKRHKVMISLNKAQAKDFMQLNGVGEKTAQKIIDYRKAHRFAWIEDIMNVSGIGEKRFESYREYLCL